ncbi:YIP1 family protein [bacterium]|nr:YIP1 family protein [candidate division CSSED10-310 bacterium]
MGPGDQPRWDTPDQTPPPDYGHAPDPLRSGPSWENQRTVGFWNGLIRTWIDSVFRPDEFFKSLNITRGLAYPLGYAIIINIITAIGTTLTQFSIPALNFWQTSPLLAEYSLSNSIIFIAMLFMTPVIAVISIFIFSAILHLFLFVAGGARKGFEATFRVVCYASGPGVFSIIPFCGSIIGAIWVLILEIVGLTRTHETDTWRSVVAVLLPIFLCCCSILMMILTLGGFMAMLGLQE